MVQDETRGLFSWFLQLCKLRDGYARTYDPSCLPLPAKQVSSLVGCDGAKQTKLKDCFEEFRLRFLASCLVSWTCIWEKLNIYPNSCPCKSREITWCSE